MPASLGFCDEGPLIAEHPPRDQHLHTYPGDKQYNASIKTPIMAKGSPLEVKDGPGSTAAE